MKAGGERRFLEPVLRHFGDTPVDAIDQNAVTQSRFDPLPRGNTVNQEPASDHGRERRVEDGRHF